MSKTANISVAQRAENISGEFGEMGVAVPSSSIEEKMEALMEFKVPEGDAQATVVRQIIDEHDLDNSELPEGVNDLVGFSGSGGSQGFDRTLLGDIEDVGDEAWVDVRAQVVDLWEVKHDSMAQVGLIADESAQMKFVKWAKNTESLPVLEEGVTYDFASVITNEYEGKYSISLNKASEVSEADSPVEPADGTVRASGAVVALEDGSGLIKRCPHEDCTRVVKNGRCSEHGEVDGEFDLRLKAVLDDGQSSIRALFNAEMTERVTGTSLEDATQMASEALDASVVLTAFREQLVGRTFEVRGPVVGDYFLVDTVVSTTYSEDNPGLEASALDAARTQRQPAKRVFAQELNGATHSFTREEDADDERAPNFHLLPSGEAANRVLVVGALYETANVGDDSEYWRGRVMAASEAINVYAGEYQSDAMNVLRSAETPCYVAVVGKIHSYETDYGVNVSVQPEHISVVDGEVRNSWVAETISHSQDRLGALEAGEADGSEAAASLYGGDVSAIEAALDEAAIDLVPEDHVPAEGPEVAAQ